MTFHYGKGPLHYEYRIVIYYLAGTEKLTSKVAKERNIWKPYGIEYEWNNEGLKKAGDMLKQLNDKYTTEKFKAVLEKYEIIELVYSPKMKKLVQYIRE